MQVNELYIFILIMNLRSVILIIFFSLYHFQSLVYTFGLLYMHCIKRCASVQEKEMCKCSSVLVLREILIRLESLTEF